MGQPTRGSHRATSPPSARPGGGREHRCRVALQGRRNATQSCLSTRREIKWQYQSEGPGRSLPSRADLGPWKKRVPHRHLPCRHLGDNPQRWWLGWNKRSSSMSAFGSFLPAGRLLHLIYRPLQLLCREMPSFSNKERRSLFTRCPSRCRAFVAVCSAAARLEEAYIGAAYCLQALIGCELGAAAHGHSGL